MRELHAEKTQINAASGTDTYTHPYVDIYALTRAYILLCSASSSCFNETPQENYIQSNYIFKEELEMDTCTLFPLRKP